MPLIPPNGIIAQAFGGVSPGQALDVGAITDNGGGATADGTIGAVTAPTALTDAIKELSTKVNLYRTYLRAAGLMA